VKKALILAYDFPPYNSIGGQRPLGWYKYLHESGIAPVVVTRNWDIKIENPIDYITPCGKAVEYEQSGAGLIIKAPFKPNLRDKLILKYGLNKLSIIRKTLTIIYQLLEFYWPVFDNRKTIFEAADKYLQTNTVDIIIATAEPFILLKYASELSEKYNTRWIADYRDGWSTNYNRSRYEQFFYKNIERSVILSSSLITTVSDEFKEQLSLLHHNKPIRVIKNGYFPEYFESIEPNTTTEFTIGFAGTLYPYQPIELFACGLEYANIDTNKLKIKFIGVNYYQEQKSRILAAFSRFEKNIITTCRLPHNSAISELNKCNILLLPASAKYAQLYAKVFDYLALRKVIILFENDKGALAQIIADTHSGVICNTPHEIAATLEQAYAEWQQTGTVACNSINIEQYSRKEQTKKLANIINDLPEN